MKQRSYIQNSIHITLLTYLFSGLCYGHGNELNPVKNHFADDLYLAEQARINDSTLPARSAPINTAFSEATTPAVHGQWGAITNWPFAFASAANLPDGRILAWGANNPNTYSGGDYTYAAIWDPDTLQFTNVNHPTHSMFCGMPVMLEDGRVFVAGGDRHSATSVKSTSTFDVSTQWTKIQDMNIGRWYNGSVALPNGKVFTAVGDPGSKYPEIWSQSTGWSYLNGVSLRSGILSYPSVTEPKNWLPHLHLAPNGQVFHSGHTPEMHYIDTEGNGMVLPVELRNQYNVSNTPSVLIDEGKILQSGGANFDINNSSTNQARLIDINGIYPTNTDVGKMLYPRIFHNEVVLPNGEVIAIGGNTTGLKFNDDGSQYIPEIWSPTTQTWRIAAPHPIPRNYHSVALLMADGRVWSGGGGLCDCNADHPDSQVYSPPYLFNADGTTAERPHINMHSQVVSYGQTIWVTGSVDISRFTLVKMSSTTHAVNTDLRFLNVPFVKIIDGGYNLTLHTNRNVMTPGYWMLFAINTQGVPSIAKVIQVNTSGAPLIQSITDQQTLVGTNINLSVQASSQRGSTLNYEATNLPQGVAINSMTGEISGIPIFPGNYRAVVSAFDEISKSSVYVNWHVTSF